MDITSLANLLRENTNVLRLSDGLRLVSEAAWVVSGETKLSYTTLIRLVECFREHHWEKDIRPQLNDNNNIDATCKDVQAQFIQPVKVGQIIDIVYAIREVRDRGYQLRFSVLDNKRLIQFAEVELVMVFIDAKDGNVVYPSAHIISRLQQLCQQTSKHRDNISLHKDGQNE